MTAVTPETMERLLSPESLAGYHEQYFRLGQLAAAAAATEGLQEAITALEKGTKDQWIQVMQQAQYAHDGLIAFGRRTGWNQFTLPAGLAHRIISGEGSTIQLVRRELQDEGDPIGPTESYSFYGTSREVPYGENKFLSRELRVSGRGIYALGLEDDIAQVVRNTDRVELVVISQGGGGQVVMDGDMLIGAWRVEDEFVPWRED